MFENERLVFYARAAFVGLALFILWGALSEKPPDLPPMPNNDKSTHALAFACLVLPLALTEPRHWVRTVLLATGLGVLIELLQPSFGRHREWLDLIANSVGIGLGFCAAHLLRRMTARFVSSGGQRP